MKASMGFDTTQSSSCSTARIKSDKSLYWRPSLFFNGDGKFHRVPEKATKIYYKFGDGDKWANVTGFPQGFNMMAGDPLRRSAEDNAAGVRWGCHQPDGNSQAIFSDGFPTGFTSCNYGFAAEVTFPSCWNGQEMDPKNSQAHMAYPNGFSGVGIENCPTTHRAARFPTIFVEFWYDISSFNGKYGRDSAPWVISNGDPTGYGFHADFMNGWETGVLEKATAETGGCNCGCGCGQAEMEACFGAENVNKDSDADFKTCAATDIYSGDDAMVLDKLPGCNPLQYGPARATVVSGAGCNAAPASSPGSKTFASSSSGSTAYSGSPPQVMATSTPPAPQLSSSTLVRSRSRNLYPSVAAVEKIDVAPTLSMSFANKNLAGATPVATAAASHYDADAGYGLPSLSLVMPADHTDTPSVHDGDDDEEEECKPPVYVTVTPTVYVTLASNATSCNGGTVYQTVRETATVTVQGIGYGKM